MPPLNHNYSDVEQADTLYTVSLTEQNCGIDSDESHDKDDYLAEDFMSATRIALREVGDEAISKELGCGLLVLFEPHDDGEKYRQAVVSEKHVYGVR